MEKIENYKVTDTEIKEQGVQAIQGDVLYGEPDENKKIFDRLSTFLIGKYNAVTEWLVDKAHIHDNKDLIDTINQENVHAHDNKELLDTVKVENVHSHDNKPILDLVTIDNVHQHSNLSTLESITKQRIYAWDNSAGIGDWDIISPATIEEAIEGINNDVMITPYSAKEVYPQRSELDAYPTTDDMDLAITSALEGFVAESVIVGSVAPEGSAKLLWVDTSIGGVPKYWNDVAWIPTKAVWG